MTSARRFLGFVVASLALAGMPMRREDDDRDPGPPIIPAPREPPAPRLPQSAPVVLERYDDPAPRLTLGSVTRPPPETLRERLTRLGIAATPEERAVTRGPTHNPGRLSRRERRRRAGR